MEGLFLNLNRDDKGWKGYFLNFDFRRFRERRRE